MTTYRIVGQPVPRLEGLDKVQGRAKYAADLTMPGMLWGKTLRSPHAHARIKRIDTSAALRVPGVRAVLTARDIPNALVGRRLRDMPVLARDKVRFIGEKVAAAAADTPEAAEEAMRLIEVEYEELPPLVDALEAMQEGAPLLHEHVLTYEGLLSPDQPTNPFFGYSGVPVPQQKPNNIVAHVVWDKGDIDAGFREADRVFEHAFTTQRVHQGYLEPHACMVSIDEDGLVHVRANNKTPYMLRKYLSEGAELPQDRIVVHPVPIGGDFGGKGSFMDVPLAYFLARTSGRPVKLVMSYLEELTAGNPRHPSTTVVRTGLNKNNEIVAREAKVIFDSGAYAAFKPGVNLPLSSDAGGPYRIPHARISSYMVYTNNVPGGHFRGPGQPQTVFAVEAHMDMIAHEIGMDPVEFRLLNLVREGDTSPIGEVWHDILAEETLRKAADAIGWGTPRAEYVGRGISVSEHHAIGGPSGATVRLEAEGSVTISTSVLDTGTGFHMVLRQTVAEVLAVPVDRVRVETQDTAKGFFDAGPGGSRVTHVSGQVACEAAEKLRRQLLQYGAEQSGCAPEQVFLEDASLVCGADRLPLHEIAKTASSEVLSASHEQGISEPHVTGFCAHAVEVHVDPETGQVRLLRAVASHDVGKIINPLAHQGQLEGGLVQGIGYALIEHLPVVDGQVTATTFAEFKLPTVKDIPPLTTVILESEGGTGPFRSKAIGEHPVAGLAPAIAEAVYDAVSVRIPDLPITAEKVFAGLCKRQPGASEGSQESGVTHG